MCGCRSICQHVKLLMQSAHLRCGTALHIHLLVSLAAHCCQPCCPLLHCCPSCQVKLLWHVGVKHSLYSAAKLDYGKAGLLPDGGGSFSADEQRTILLALQQLYKAPGSSMSFDLFTDMLPKPQMPTYSLLQKMNVVESYDGYTVVFSSKPIAAYLNNVLLAAHGISSDASAARLLQHCCD